jgi:hypothetical protein
MHGTTKGMLVCAVVAVAARGCHSPAVTQPVVEAEPDLVEENARFQEAQLIASPPLADAEVPETFASAHRFLAIAFAGSPVLVEALTEDGWNVGARWHVRNSGSEQRVAHEFAPSIALGASNLDRCTTLLRYQTPGDWDLGQPDNPAIVQSPMLGKHFSIAWDRVVSIDLQGSYVILNGTSPTSLLPPAAMRFHFGSEAAAIRVAYVFEFLHLYCKEGP